MDNVAHLDQADQVRAMEHRRMDEVHPCVAPGCDRRAVCVFMAAADGRLGGSAWREGDLVDLCFPHTHDVYRSQGVWDVSKLAPWLQADAHQHPIDAIFDILDGLT
jgi:hypothetical protein